MIHENKWQELKEGMIRFSWTMNGFFSLLIGLPFDMFWMLSQPCLQDHNDHPEDLCNRKFKTCISNSIELIGLEHQYLEYHFMFK